MPPVLSIWSVVGLLIVLAASCAMFWAHVHVWTHGRKWAAMREWASDNKFVPRRAGGTAPLPLASITLPPPVVELAVVGKRAMFLQIRTPQVGESPPQRWNVLLRELEVDWPPTALRPVRETASLVDLFALASFPALLSSDRFNLHGVDAPAARELAKSSVKALLPPDLGLVLQGRRMVIDFSRRPFDGIEFSRILALSDQLAAHLPDITN